MPLQGQGHNTGQYKILGAGAGYLFWGGWVSAKTALKIIAPAMAKPATNKGFAKVNIGILFACLCCRGIAKITCSNGG